MAAVITAGRPSRTRQIRAAVTLLLALGLLGGAFYKAYSYIQNDTRSPVERASDCATGTLESPIAKPAVVIVNVYNATDKAGLAADVGRKMRERGYQVADIANDPTKKKISGVGEIRYGVPGRAAARSVRLAVRGAKLVNDKREDDTIDLAIGKKFKELSPLPTCSTKTAD